MRLFIALDVNKQTRAALIALQRDMERLGIAGDYVPAGNFHVTLRFLGEVGDLGGVALAMAEAVRGIRPFSLTLDRADVFGQRTAVVKTSGGEGELKALFESAEAALSAAGFPQERRPLLPHLTLARRVCVLPDALEKLNSALIRAEFFADHITLYESVRGRYGGIEYHALQRNAF